MLLDNEAQRVIAEFLETLFTHSPDIMGVDETIAGCEITDMDAYSTGTTPRYIRVRLQGGDAVAGGYLVDAFWRGGPSLGVGDSCTVLHLRDGNRYEVIGAGGSTGVSTFTDVYQHIWVYDVSLGLLKPYTTINAALAYALLAAGDYVLIPPGTYDENITLVDGVFVCEQVPGTVEIVATGGTAAVTIPAAGGNYYINIHTIKIERSLNSAAAANGLAAVVCSHVSGVATIFADLYCKNTYNTGDANSMGIRNVDAGDVVYRGKDAEWSIYVQSDGDDWGSYGVRSESTGGITGYGSMYVYSPNAGCWAYCIQNRAAAVIEWHGNLKLSCDYDGDIIQLRGGATVILNGDMDGYSNEHIRGVLARDGACTVHIRGKMVLDTLTNFAIGVENSYGGYVSSSEITYEGIIDVTTANGSARGVQISAGTCTGSITLLDVNVKAAGTGDSYGVNNEIINSTITVVGGMIETSSSGGNAYDLRRTAGTLRVFYVQHDTVTGTITWLDGTNVHDHSTDLLGGQNLRDIQELQAAAATELTIAVGVITRTQVYHSVDTEAGAATDNLDTINGGTEGDILVIRAEDSTRTVVVRTGVGNIVLSSGSNISLDDATDHLLLFYDGTDWCDDLRVAGGVPGGADTEIQYNSGGAFAGDSDLTWDDSDKVLNLATNIWRIGETALDLDFTGTDYDTVAECNAVGLRFSDSDTPFPDTLHYPIDGTWVHTASRGWYNTPGVDSYAAAIIIPLDRPTNWLLDVYVDFTFAAAAQLARYSFGYITASGHSGAVAQIDDGSSSYIRYLAKLYTNDGDDTVTARYTGTGLYGAAVRRIQFASRNGCVGLWDDQDNSWHWYEGRQSVGIAYTPTHLYLSIRKVPSYTITTGYIQNLKLNYLL